MSDEAFLRAIARPEKTQSKPKDRPYPTQGDIIKFRVPPGIAERYGNEIYDKERSWIVISSDSYNLDRKNVRVCPTKSNSLNTKWEIPIPSEFRLHNNTILYGFVLIESQTVDWNARQYYLVGKCNRGFLQKIINLDREVTQSS